MVKQFIKKILKSFGYDLVKTSFPFDMDNDFKSIYNKCKKYSMTSVERLFAMYKATEYIVDHKIPGDVVECGVWQGGSSMVSAYTLLNKNEASKRIYMYDTYEGMSEPTDKDISFNNESAKKQWELRKGEDYNQWCYSPLETVKKNLLSTGYPKNKLVFVKGKVEDTIPKKIPQKISLLRLDTDWYESTYHELIHLYPKLSINGILIIDDYGHWKGAREAVDKYFEENEIKILLNRIDYAGRIGIKS